MRVKVGGLDVMRERGVTFNGIVVAVRLDKNVSSFGLSPTQFDLSAVQVDAILKRNGKIYDVCHGNLKALAIESAFNTSMMGYAIENGSAVRLTPAQSGTPIPETQMLPLMIDFGEEGHLNLRGNDEFEVSLRVRNDFIKSDDIRPFVNDAGTYVEVTLRESIGKEVKIPQIVMKPLNNNESRIDWSLGDRVERISIINLDIPSFYENDAVVRNITVKADKGLYINDTFEQLLVKLHSETDSTTSIITRSQNFRLYNGIELNNVQLGVDLYNSRITAGNNYVIYRTFYTNQAMVELAMTTEKIHAVENAAKMGVQVDVGSSVNALESQKQALINER